MESLFNPFAYKAKECPDRSEDNKFTCTKRGELCSLYHSNEEKELAFSVMKKVHKDLP